MTTSRITSAAVAITALALVSTSAPTGAGIAPTSPSSSTRHAHAEKKGTTKRRAAAPAPRERYAYAWPVKPFRQQHPVRGFFGDPRFGHAGSRQFHFGIDISAPNGTPVYATLTGTAYIHPLHATTIGVVGRGGVEFSYWHVVPTVRTGQWVVAYRTVIGHIEEPYGHVHFSEMRDGRYLNPLRSGALGPYADETRPTVRSVRMVGGELVAETYDETPLAVPRPWYDLPVMPALVRWRPLDADGRALRSWATVVDFRLTIPPASEFDTTWATGTIQNHVRAPGHYRLVLTRDPSTLRHGAYVEVAVRDTRGNGSVARFPAGLSGS